MTGFEAAVARPAARVLVTAAASRLARGVVQELEGRDDVATVIAVDDRPPSAPFRAPEFVRLGADHAQLPRVVEGAQIDVLVDLRAAAALAPPDDQRLRDHGVVTAAVVAACAADASPVRRLVTVGSVHRYGWASDQPAFVRETTPLPSRPTGPIQRALAEIEDAAAGTAADRPALDVTTVRLADVVGPGGSGLLQAADRLPLLPTVLGFDPPWQVVHEDDAGRAIALLVGQGRTGDYLVAADGTLALSEALRALGRPHAPLLPPWGTGLLARILQRAGVATAHDLAGLLRHGRGIDNRRLKATGFAFGATSREALESAAGTRRRRRLLGGASDPRSVPYEPEVEAFLRYSPAARRPDATGEPTAPTGIGALDVDALVLILGSMDGDALRALRAHEQAGPRRGRVLDEIDLLLRSA